MAWSEGHRWTAVPQLHRRPEQRVRLAAATGRTDTRLRHRAERFGVHDADANVRHVCGGGGRPQRPPVPDRGRAQRPEQCLRHQFPARLLPKGVDLVGAFGRSVLPAPRLAELPPPPLRGRGIRRATGT